MNIAIFKRAIAFGGGEQYTKSIVEYLEKKNKVILISNSHFLLDKIECKSKIHISVAREAIRKKEIAIFVSSYLSQHRIYSDLCRQLKKEKIDILVLQDINEKALLTRVAARHKIKVVWVEHNLIENGLTTHPLFPMMKKSQLLTTAVIIPSNILLNQCRSAYKNDNFFLIAHGVIELNNKPDNNAPKLIMAARLSLEKGVGDAILALSKLKQKTVGLHIYGEGDERDNLVALSEKLQIADRVSFHGHVKNPLEHSNKGDIFLMPSFVENFPLALLEAMSCELAIVATKVGGIVEVIRDGENGFLYSREDGSALANIIDMLLSDDDLRRKASQAARQDYLKYYQESKMLKTTEETLNNLL